MTYFRVKPRLITIPFSEHVPFSDEEPLLERIEFFVISHVSYQPLNCLSYLTLSMGYRTFMSLRITK